MQTLFGEVEDNKDLSLKISVKGRKVLSKNQQLFNKLTKRIEFLEKKIVKDDEKLSKILEVYIREVESVNVQIAKSRMQLSMTLGKATEQYKFTKKQIEAIREIILDFCNDAFNSIMPNEEEESFYDKWSETSYKEEIEEQDAELKDTFSDFMRNMFGMDIDMEGYDDSPEGNAKFEEEMRSRFEQSQKNQRTQKKSKKQMLKEEAQKADDTIKNKSIRSIYIALAKILHPDVETDIQLKLEKEEVMKEVTVAYEQKDLPKLLKLEMEWVHKTSEHLEKITDEKLQIYILALKQQVAELERERTGLYYNLRYQKVSGYAYMPQQSAINRIVKDASELKSVVADLNSSKESFEKPNAKKEIATFIKKMQVDHDFIDDFYLTEEILDEFVRSRY